MAKALVSTILTILSWAVAVLSMYAVVINGGEAYELVQPHFAGETLLYAEGWTLVGAKLCSVVGCFMMVYLGISVSAIFAGFTETGKPGAK